MIPIGDTPDQRRTRFPIVTILLLLANVAVFVYQLSLGPAINQFVASFGVVPAEIARGVDIPPNSPDPVYLTLFSAMFMHGGFLHIAGNMLYLWIFGDNVEDALGHIPFLGFYLLAGLMASLIHVFVDPSSTIPSIGASGAIAGVLAGYLVLFPTASVRTLLLLGPFITMARVSAFILIGFWAVLQFISGLASLGADTAQTSGVAFWAHIGGFVVGLVVVGGWKMFRGNQAAPFPG